MLLVRILRLWEPRAIIFFEKKLHQVFVPCRERPFLFPDVIETSPAFLVSDGLVDDCPFPWGLLQQGIWFHEVWVSLSSPQI